MSVKNDAAHAGCARVRASDLLRGLAGELASAPLRILQWVARRIEAACIRYWINSDERYYEASRDGGKCTEEELRLMRLQLQRLR